MPGKGSANTYEAGPSDAVADSLLEAIGNTPLVRLRRIGAETGAAILVKPEGLNPGGSIKSRTAWWMIERAERAGRLRPDSIIVEPTSGNQGIGIAMVAAIKGYSVRIVMPECMSRERRLLIQAYGAEVVLVPQGRDIAETIDACITTARQMAADDPRVFIPQQFENPDNPEIHRLTTGPEILRATGGQVDAFVAGIGTGGTITGVGEVLRESNPCVRIVAVEPANGAILSRGKVGMHRQEGIGDGLIPPILNRSLITDVMVVEDEDAVATARRLAREEGILAGVSSGANVWAAVEMARRLGSEMTVVTILPDTGERYLSTDLFSQS